MRSLGCQPGLLKCKGEERRFSNGRTTEKNKKIQKTFEPQYRYAHLRSYFIYVIICVILYFQTDHIVRYEVTEGSLAIQ